MITLTLQIDVRAPAERCFDLARSMDFHTRSMRATGERIVSGRSSGLIEASEEVEFEARHLGMTRRLRARITGFERPRRFVDEQVAGGGDFRSLRHEHRFEEVAATVTRVTDEVRIEVGLGPIGWLAERLLVAPHLRRLLSTHQRHLKEAAESEAWRGFLERP